VTAERFCVRNSGAVAVCEVSLNREVALRPNTPYCTTLLCLMPDDFTVQGRAQWVVYANGQIIEILFFFHNLKLFEFFLKKPIQLNFVVFYLKENL
jgi:hypothetical protein